jgi:DNA-binding CsgD family transcriptional regulator
VQSLDVVNVSHRELVGREDVFSFTTGPEAWKAYYIEQNFAQLDPTFDRLQSGNRVHYMCFDMTHPMFKAKGRMADMFDGTYHAMGRGALCLTFNAATRTRMVTLFTDAPAAQFDSWAQANGPRLRLMGAAFSAKMQSFANENVAPQSALTSRELDCVAWLAEGLRVSAIAHQMGITERTVEFHLSNARAKLGAKTRENLVARVLRG